MTVPEVLQNGADQKLDEESAPPPAAGQAPPSPNPSPTSNPNPAPPNPPPVPIPAPAPALTPAPGPLSAPAPAPNTTNPPPPPDPEITPSADPTAPTPNQEDPEIPLTPTPSSRSIYARFPPHRKLVIVALLSFCSLLSPVSSTSVLAATPEVAAEYGTDGTIINVINAVYMLVMGVSPVVWGPMSEVWGRRRVNQITAVLFVAASIGTALAPNLAAFFVFRVLTAFEGTAFILVGSACISDIYHPTERATALGWFLSGTLIGPALGPFIGGIIVTYASWRVIFWLQAGLAGLAALFTFTPFLPETIHHRKADDLEGFSRRQKVTMIAEMVNPVRVLRLFVYPNLITASLASSAVIWNMYSLLTPIRYVLNPRFHLTTPMQSGLFYLAPGCGYLVGTLIGGRYADHVVKSWIVKRGGVRQPEDRLRSSLPAMGIVIPACLLIYGWGVEKEVGGIPLAVITLFVQGVAQLFCFPSLNTYCLDVMQGRGAEVIAGNYFVRYLFACAATACVLPAVQAIGVGWFSTITAVFLVASTAAIQATIWWGKNWRDGVDSRRRARRAAEHDEHGEESKASKESKETGGRVIEAHDNLPQC